MARLTRQEQTALWVLLILLAGGAAGRWWIRHQPASHGAGAPAIVTPTGTNAPGR